MAKSNRPLRVVVHPDLWDAPDVVELREKQNVVVPMEDWVTEEGDTTAVQADLVIGPNCWRIVPGMEGQIEHAIKAARRVKYGPKGEEGDA